MTNPNFKMFEERSMLEASIPSRITTLLLLFFVAIGGCTGPKSGTAPGDGKLTRASKPERATIRIGYQKATALDVLRLSGDLDRRLASRNVRADWTNFAAGPQTLEAMNGGSIDLSSMGDAPPIFGQAAGIPLVYVANEPPGDGSARAILVANGSPIRSVKDLRGKRIAVQKASGTHNFLIQALDKAGVPYDSVTIEFLAPADGRVAFESGRVDAWAIWDPFLAAAEQDGKARVLVNGAGVVTSGDFYLSSREFARAHPDWIKVVLSEVDRTAKWIDTNPRKAAELLAPSLAVSVDKLEAIQKRAHHGAQYVGFRPMTPEIVETQQKVADVFQRTKLLPKHVDIREALLTPDQYAALTPPPVPAK